MIVRMGLLNKRDDLSHSAFRKHWREVHGPIAAKLPGLRRYHQNHIVDRKQLGIKYPRGAEYDGISELWFDDLHSMNEAFTSDVAQQLIADESNLLSDISTITAVQHVVIPEYCGSKLVKRMSTVQRKPGISSDQFKSEWFDVHSFLIKRFSQIKGYTQNFIFDRTNRRRPASYEDLSIDGIVELWFDDLESLNSCFESPAGTTLMTHVGEFISTISTFLVEVEQVT